LCHIVLTSMVDGLNLVSYMLYASSSHCSDPFFRPTIRILISIPIRSWVDVVRERERELGDRCSGLLERKELEKAVHSCICEASRDIRTSI
jgi:hypothetical protein